MPLTKPSPSRHEIHVHSVIPYPSNQTSRGDNRDTVFRQLLFALKDDKPWRDERGAEYEAGSVLAAWLDEGFAARLQGAALIPVPRSSVCQPQLFPSHRFCSALARAGLGSVVPALRRTQAVASASGAAPSNRPKIADHMASLSIDTPNLAGVVRAVVVDDTLTRGTQLAAAAMLLEVTGVREVLYLTAAYVPDFSESDRAMNVQSVVSWTDLNGWGATRRV